ncbi:MAG TPA: ABC transporter substrate-binding protein [Verrucomicrobiae bacterium]|nr:ABC transporter substrate-binding protein [Verrucomicrobiae bacterium]
MRPREIFPRMLENVEFEVSELSLGSYVSLKGRGICRFVAVPVALSKIFRHSCIYIRSDAGIGTPRDLRGKRVGTTQLGSTATIFMNGMLQHEYGVTLEDMQWFIGGLTTPTQRPLIPLKLPEKNQN